MSGRLTGKVAIVTGASASIGNATTLALATEGAQLVLTAHRKERLEELAAAIDALGTKTLVIPGDDLKKRPLNSPFRQL
jgi:NADP-dependent 3-hydroxy acid dehydrogenase YdfG